MKFSFFLLFGLTCIFINAQKLIHFGNVQKLSDKINSSSEELMPLVSNDGKSFYFVRARHEENVGGATAGHDIWSADFKGSDFDNVNNNFGKLNNGGNNAIVGINTENSKLYLLNAYQTESKLEKGLALTDDKFSKPTFVQIDGMDYSSQFYGFYVNPEETVMFISMEGSNSKGQEDLYVSVNNNGSWSKPIHLGGSINSSGFEISPFLSRDGKRLYFSSNGHGGEGDADIFYVERTGSGWMSWGDPINLGSDINSSGFDAYFIEGIDSTGYFSSTRDSKNSDIYSLSITWKKVTPIESVEPLEITEIPKENAVIDESPQLPDLKVSNIYFDNKQFNLREDAKESLDYLVKIMKEMPNLLVTLEGHADKVDNDKFNQLLSEKRAEETKKYLISKGVENSRISFIGFGESKPDEACEDCTEEQLQKNRRVEFMLSWKK